MRSKFKTFVIPIFLELVLAGFAVNNQSPRPAGGLA